MVEHDLRRIRRENLRVLVAEFGAVWAAAEDQATTAAEAGVTDWFAGGVTRTCRWLAGATYESRGQRRLPVAPITGRTSSAIEELIEAEYIAAVILAEDTTSPLVRGRPGYVEAVVAALGWAWRHNGPAPRLDRSNASSHRDQV
ncbi:hypothetical protein TOK_5404 [Pseudonocardia sp. N23]|nr:hypothetical protein TOK_5404 [Pseudonocardia sp. N23]